MGIFNFLNQFKTDDKLPEFGSSDMIRRHLIFSGRVQGVGFRYTFYQKGRELDLVGWVKNLSNGDVEAEIQGEKDKIEYLLNYMKNRPVIEIDKTESKEIDLIDGENDIKIDY